MTIKSQLTCGDWLEVCKELADLTPETVPAVDGVVAEFTASLADIEKGSSSLAQPRPPLSFFLISLSFDKKGESCSFLLFVLILKIVKECDQTRFWTLKKRQNNCICIGISPEALLFVNFQTKQCKKHKIQIITKQGLFVLKILFSIHLLTSLLFRTKY